MENTESIQNTLNSVYELDSSGFGRLASQEIMLFIENNISISNLSNINLLLESVELSKLSPHSISGLIRCTARLREHLPAWNITYMNAHKEITKLGKDSERLFVGLPNIEDLVIVQPRKSSP